MTTEEILKDVCGFSQSVKITELDNEISAEEALRAMQIHAEQYFTDELQQRFPDLETLRRWVKNNDCGVSEYTDF
jgi:hypothetical protein